MGVEIINTLLLVFRRQIGQHDNLRSRGQGFQRLRRTGGWLNVPRLGVEKFVDEVRKLDWLIGFQRFDVAVNGEIAQINLQAAFF